MVTAAFLFTAIACVGTGITFSEMGPGEKMNPLIMWSLIIAGVVAALLWLLIYLQ